MAVPDLTLTADCRQPHGGDCNLFFALAGVKTDGGRFAAEAASRGAVAIVAASDAPLPGINLPVIRAADPRLALARMAAAFFGPQPRVIGAVTGTAGKTSVASFLRQIWAHAGEQAAMIGTTGVIAPGRIDYGTLTTPDPVALHRLLADLASGGVTHAAMEASSHGLDQRRLDGLTLTVAGQFTNRGPVDTSRLYIHDMDAYMGGQDATVSETRFLPERRQPAVDLSRWIPGRNARVEVAERARRPCAYRWPQGRVL